MADNKKQNTVLHKRSTKKNVLPKGETLQYGEIAVNYNAEAPFLSIRKEGENKEYAKFSADEVIAKMFDEKYVTIEDLEDNEEVIASALNELNDRIESIQGVNIGNSTGESSLLQKVEVETFVDENPNSPTNGQEIPTEASGNHSVVLNGKSNASAKRALAHGNRTIAQGENSHTEGHCTQTVCIDEVTNGYAAHAEGYASMAGGTYSHAEGNKTKTSAPNSHAEGYLSITTPEAESSHAEGYETSTEAPASHTEGNNTKTHKAYSHAEGRQTETFGEASHTEGNETITEGDYAHAEGWMTRAKGAYSHAEGQYTFTYADAAHSEGNNTHAQAPFSHAEGLGTKTNPDIIGQHVEGYYNADSDGVKVIGCGTAVNARMNAVEVKQDGRVFVKGLGNFDGTNSNVAADLTHVIHTKADKNDVYGRGHLDNLFNTKANKDDVYGKSEVNNLLNSKENISKKVQIISSASETSEYPSAKAVYDYAAPISHIHDDRYYTESEIDKKFDDVASRYGFGNILVGDKTVTADINVDTLTLKGENGITLTPELDTDTITIAIESDKFAPKSHTHTKSEITDFAHNHDDRYYTESEVDAKISGITAASLGLSAALKYCGITTTELVDGSTTNPVVIGGNNHTAEQGCVVFYEDGKNTKEFVFNGTKWELLGSDLTYKVVQNAVSSPTANGNAVSFIDTISQDANGVITATKKNVDMPVVKGDAENSAVLKGGNNKVTNANEVALGEYNKSNNDTRFSIGIGTSDTDRKNAHEITTDGKHYILGIGGYDGTKLDGVQTLQEVINAKADVIPLVNITYNELKDLRDNSQLIPGQQYRITDYVTTTTQSNTQSAGHQFDIIVTADDVNVLNEKARAIQHEGDTYFANSDLNAWEIWYSLDNDTSRFAWADESNGKGVIYYMKDEWYNECPYDFKNIKFARWELSNPVGYRYDYDEDNWVEETTSFDSLKTGFYEINGSTNVFFYGYGENDGYDKYKVEYTISESPTYCYTFGKDTDYSISGLNYGNVIKEYKNSNKIQLNNIVFLGINCNSNTFGDNCYYNSFGNNCYYNSFGKYCYLNSFGNSCYSNSFGNNCYYNSFGNVCYSNSFGNYCFLNSFGNSCYYNSLDNSCYTNSFGEICVYNSFGDNCYSNGFGNNCTFNTFGDNCYYNSFGKNCHSNSFGNSCISNSFVYKKEEDSEIIMDNVKKVHFGDGCNNIKLYADSDIVGTISNVNSIQNIDVAQGLSFNSSTIIELTTLGQDYEIKVARNSAGDIKVFCLADLIA